MPNMRIKRTIIRGQPGAKKWEKRYGSNLLCVRYRYDEQNSKKITTVELIVEEKNWNGGKKKIPHNKIMGVRVMYGEKEIASLVKHAGGKWNRKEQVWELPYGEALSLGIEDRIVHGIKFGVEENKSKI